MALPDLFNLAIKRAEISSIKCSNQHLINHELSIHQNSIKEYLSKETSTLKTTLSSSSQCQLNLQNFLNQPHIDSRLRSRMLDSLITYHLKLKLSTPTLFQSISIMDRISCNYIIKDYNYKLIAVVSLWISSKFHDSKRRVPTLPQLIQLTQYRYNSKEICSMELIVLNSLGWNIQSSNTYDTYIDSLLFPYLQELGDDINSIKIWMLIICELCLFDIQISMQYGLQAITNCAFQMALTINRFSYETKKLRGPDLTNLHNDYDVAIFNKIKTYLFAVDFEFPISVRLKYRQNILFNVLKDYFMDQTNNMHAPEANGMSTMTISPQFISTKQPSNTINYKLPMTPTTPNYSVPQKKIAKKPFCDIEENADLDSDTISAKRVCMYK